MKVFGQETEVCPRRHWRVYDIKLRGEGKSRREAKHFTLLILFY